MIEKLAQFTDIRCCLIVGGLSTKVDFFCPYCLCFEVFGFPCLQNIEAHLETQALTCQRRFWVKKVASSHA